MGTLYKAEGIQQNVAMRKLSTLFATCGLSLLAGFSAPAQSLPAAITTDPPPDKEFPAVMEAPEFLSHGSRLNSVLYIASGREPHPIVLLMHGFPGNEKNLDLAYAMCRAGWNVLIPHYRGAWGSAGTFSFANAIEDTHAAIQFVRDPENARKYRIDPKRIVLIGHSMGGFMVANAAANDPEVSAIAMISAWNIGATMSGPKEAHRVDMIPSASIRLAGTTAAGLQAEAEANAAKWNYVDYAEALKSRPVLIVESHDRNVTFNHAMVEALQKAGNPRVQETYIETDHGYTDHRIALQVALLNWLQSTFPPPAK